MEYPMPTDRRRVTLIAEPDTLSILGYDLDAEGVSITDAHLAPLRRYARQVEQAGRELQAVLDRKEWNYLADVLNGCGDLWDLGDPGLPSLALIRAEADDGDRLNGLGKKWKVDVPDMLRKLEALSPAHGEAILAAVRWFWSHPEAIDHKKDEWWHPRFRRPARDKE